MIRYLTVQEIIALNHFIIERYSPLEIKGIKEPSLLYSAVNRPKQSVFSKDAYPDVFTKAAALFESIAKNHCFHNANKRTAFIAVRQFLMYNGYDFIVDPIKAADFVVDSVTNEYTFEEIVLFLNKNSYPRQL